MPELISIVSYQYKQVDGNFIYSGKRSFECILLHNWKKFRSMTLKEVHSAHSVVFEQFSCDHQLHSKMMSSKSATLFIGVLFISLLLFNVGASYRKPPFNGSIFGKRGNTLEYDTAGKTLSAMCEIASEACQAWFPNQEKK
ncbi:hypothetical protein WA026_017556 [Henosepilachna vigintioctopunctata]|uniref:Uncharacterized protein n=1 Tax=Henosepilachna vigintioctopunctata TaxID=420089 RepID=A0AAW1UZV4_9CUCU